MVKCRFRKEDGDFVVEFKGFQYNENFAIINLENEYNTNERLKHNLCAFLGPFQMIDIKSGLLVCYGYQQAYTIQNFEDNYKNKYNDFIKTQSYVDKINSFNKIVNA